MKHGLIGSHLDYIFFREIVEKERKGMEKVVVEKRKGKMVLERSKRKRKKNI